MEIRILDKQGMVFSFITGGVIDRREKNLCYGVSSPTFRFSARFSIIILPHLTSIPFRFLSCSGVNVLTDRLVGGTRRARVGVVNFAGSS
jgi:hypothetical protein